MQSLAKLLIRNRFNSFLLRTLIIFGLVVAGVATGPLAHAADQPAGRVAIVGATATAAFDESGATIALAPGDMVTATARTEDGAWFAITSTDGSHSWIAAEQLIIFGSDSLPVRPLPAPVAASAAAQAADRVESTTTATPLTVTTLLTDTGQITTTTSMSDILALLESLTAETGTASVTPAATPAVTAAGAAAERTPVTATAPLPAMTVQVTSQGLNVRSGPGIAYPIIAEVKAGDQLPVRERDERGDWLQITLPAGTLQGQAGWVAAGYVRSGTPITELPVAATDAAAPTSNQEAADVGTPASVVGRQPPVVGDQSSAASSPTGLSGKLVFSDGNGGAIYLYDLASGALRTLTNGIDPALSPDGSEVVFTRSGGENGIYVINTDGSGERKIFGERELLTSPKWSPDGQWIVFSRLDGTYKCVDTGRALCPSVKELLGSIPGGLSEEQLAAVQARRAKILANLDTVSRPNWALARIDPAGGDYRDIAALNSALAPDWNEAGIVYQSTAGLQRTADTPEDANQAIFSAYNIQDPDWQTNGGRIVYQQKRGSRWEIFRINPDGTGNVVLTQPKTTLVSQMPSNVAPAWSPDGQHIVFLSNREENGEAGTWRIWVMDADGSNQRPLPIDVPLTYGYAQEQMVSWGR